MVHRSPSQRADPNSLIHSLNCSSASYLKTSTEWAEFPKLALRLKVLAFRSNPLGIGQIDGYELVQNRICSNVLRSARLRTSLASDKEGMAMRSGTIDVAGIKIHRPGTL